MALRRAVCKKVWWDPQKRRLTTETVQGASLALESVDDVHGGDSLALGVFGVGDGITDNVLEEHLEHTTSLLVDEARDPLDSTTTCQTTDGGLGNTLDVITQHFAMTLRSSLPQTLASLSATRHVARSVVQDRLTGEGRFSL